MMLTNEELAAIEARANVAIREGWVEQLDASVRDINGLLAEARLLRKENERVSKMLIEYGEVVKDVIEKLESYSS